MLESAGARAWDWRATISKKNARRPANAAGTPPRGGEARPGRPGRPARTPAPEGRPGFFARHGRALTWGLAAAYALLFSAVSIRKHRLYLYNDFDFAIFVQATDRILHGSFYSSIAGMNLLGAHSVLILALLAPIFAVFHHPATLLVAQSVGLGLGAIPVYRMAARQFGPGFTAVSMAVLYLAFPAVGHVNLFEFHPESLATPALLFAFDYAWQGRVTATAVAALLAVLGREDAAFPVALLGGYALVTRRPRAWLQAGVLWALAVVSLGVTFGVLQRRYATGEVQYIEMYRAWGHTMGEVAVNVLTHPVRLLQWLFGTPDDAYDTGLKLKFYVQMLGPLLFLPLLSPWTLLIAAPILVEHFLSFRITQHMIIYQYTALMTPFVMMAAVLGLRNFLKFIAGRRDWRAELARPGSQVRRAAVVVPILALLASLAANLVWGALTAVVEPPWKEKPEAVRPLPSDLDLLPYRDRMVAKVPARGGVVCGFEYIARFAARDNVHPLHHLLDGHYTFSTKPYPVPRDIHAMIGELDQQRMLGHVNLGTGPRFRELIAANDLRLADLAGGLSLYLRGSEAPADSIELWSMGRFRIATPFPRRLIFSHQLAYLGCELMSRTAEPGGLFPVRTYWQRLAAVDRIFIIQFILIDEERGPVYDSQAFLGSLINPVHLWPDTGMARATNRIIIPVSQKPGRYLVALRVINWTGSTGLAQCDDAELAQHEMMFPLGDLEVVPRGRR